MQNTLWELIWGTNIKTVAMNGQGRVFCGENIPTESEKGPMVVIGKIVSLIDNLRRNEVVGDRNLDAVGIDAAIWAMLNLSKL